MRTRIVYEWVVEELEDGGDADEAAELEIANVVVYDEGEFEQAADHYRRAVPADLALRRSVVEYDPSVPCWEIDPATDIASWSYAYFGGGKLGRSLPEHFDDGAAVPAKFRKLALVAR